MSIAENMTRVEPRHAVIHNEATINTATNYGGYRLEEVIPKSAAEVKEITSFRRLMELDGHNLKPSGGYYKCRCPFHKDKTPSFSIYPNEIFARCFGCGWEGDVFDYVMKRDKVKFGSALKTVAEDRRIRISKRDPFQKKKFEDIPPLTDEQKAIMTAAVAHLVEDDELQEQIAESRKWKPETILLLAKQGYLGWDGKTLAFIYPNGLKLREWPEKKFWWKFGHQHLWRGDRINKATHIFLTEGETDAITLLDVGMEKDGSVVVCVPGASAFKEEWAVLFTGKTVTLCFDNDDAGRIATQRVAAMLRPYASELLTVNIGEVA